jgi:hypothetical protein
MMAPSLETPPPALREDYYLTPDLRKKYLLVEPIVFDEKSAIPSAKVDWEPNLATYQARTARRLLAGDLITSLPDKWPRNIDSPLAWHPKDLQEEEDYVVTLTSDEKAVINAALAYFQSEYHKSQSSKQALIQIAGLALDVSGVNPDTFPLGQFATRLQALAVELHSGRGFFVLRGLDPKLYTGEQNAIIFIGISSYIGETRGRQDMEGKMLGEYCKSSVVKCSLLITFRPHS